MNSKMLDYMKKYGNIIRKYREKEGMTIDELAAKLQCWNRVVALWERGLLLPENHWHSLLVEILKIAGEDAEFIMCPRPEIILYQEEIVIPGLQGDYRFLQITDAHVVIPDEDATPERIAYETPRMTDFVEDGLTPQERLDIIRKYVEQTKPDAVLMTGDIIDCPFNRSIQYLIDYVESLETPYMYVFGNHDWKFADQDVKMEEAIVQEQPKFQAVTDGNPLVQKKKIGEMTLIGLNNTRGFYEKGTARALKKILENEEHVLILQHLPFAVETLSDDCKAWWHGGDIYTGTQQDASEENKAVLDIITDRHSPVRAVIAGDLHFYHKDMLKGVVPQYIGLYASGGGATLFHIHG